MKEKILLRDCGGKLQKEKSLFENARQKRGVVYLEGILQRADALNKNGRIYGKSILSEAMSSHGRLIKENRAYGELDHPQGAEVELQNVSHMLVDYGWDGDDVKGVIQIIPTAKGKTLMEIVNAGGVVGISSRGLGSVQETRRGQEVQEDFELTCFDVVADPSTIGAFLMPQRTQGRRKVASLSESFRNADPEKVRSFLRERAKRILESES